MLQHQIVQSPARLGLTNPNSPSIQNPTPPKFPSSSQLPPQPPPPHSSTTATSTTSSTTSAALLSLLPPLRRAQSLLHQMSFLAAKLFDVSPNRSFWLSSFRGSLPTFLSSTSSSPPPLDSSSISSSKEILAAFASLQEQLFQSVAELQEILDLQDAKQRISREIKAKDSALLSFANKLKEAESVLDVLMDDYSIYSKPKRLKANDNDTTVASRIDLSDILSYAHRISYTTFAPPEFGAGNAPLRGAFPPAPQEEQMRASQLYAFADLDVGLPKIETKEKIIEAIVEPPPEPSPIGNFGGMLPPNFTVPTGWKPGMPVVLPKDLPPPPPGWKPGDPLPLPPLESLQLPRTGEQPMQPPAAVPPQGLHKQPETIQVRHVQLDILDQDDDSSDYSSDEGSSDDED